MDSGILLWPTDAAPCRNADQLWDSQAVTNSSFSLTMTEDGLVDGRVSTSQIQRAVDALHAYEKKKQAETEETELLPGKEPTIWLNVTIKQIPLRCKIKPHKIPIEYPLVDPRTTSICLITKDPQREYKDLLETNNIKFISRVVGIAKLKGKFKAFEARRLLLKENGLFLADDRVVPLLPKLLGSKWFEAKKQPIPVRLTRKDLKSELERAISTTCMHQNNGTCTSIKVATLSHTPAQALANICRAIPAVAIYTKGGWDNIQSLMLKTSTSVSLPIWSCSLGERWTALMQSEEEKGKVHKKQANGKRPVQEGESEESEKPRKKVKSDKGGSAPVASSGTELSTNSIKNDQQAEPVIIVQQKKESGFAAPSTEPRLESSGLKRKRTSVALGKKDKVVSAKAGLKRKSVRRKILKKRLQA